ncbi:polysaccharide biosynthesis tyrosine autokinase [Paucihalobacter ruber]|uniref:non-specific protein-tyrosine kinase n=1 Tax=Paucihalobacter ruber TaxID=2567861 RepID=A0A506PPU5_9FLAO|nr:polysaccharide biosynthesis tyrosine autokinase [Paucihalobacter ruber]TPV35731.1 polysaccharide biosynthesis tyrosine autokinase [Paucihalobacter ruber]
MQTEPSSRNVHTIEQGQQIKNEAYKYLRFWYWFALGLFLGLVWAYLNLRYTPKVYNSTAKIKILNKTKGLELPSAAFVFSRSNINLENEIEILKSYRIIEQVVKRLDLTMQFYEEGNILTTELDRLPFTVIKKISNDSVNWATYTIKVTNAGFDVTRGESAVQSFEGFSTFDKKHNLPFELQGIPQLMPQIEGRTYLIRFSPVMPLTTGLKGRVNISVLGKGSDLLQLSYNGQSRAKSEKILNTLIEVFNEDGIYDRQEISRRTISFIDERFLLLANELDSIESSIKDYKQSNNLITLETDAALGISQRTTTEEELFVLENQIILANMLKETLETGDESTLLPSNIGLSSGDVNALIAEYNTQVLERDKFAQSGGENNPSIKLYNDALKDLKENMLSSIGVYLNQLKVSKQQMERRNQQFVSQVYGLPAKEKMLRAIMRQQEIKQTLYLFLLQKREEAAINLAITEPSIKVVEYALSGGMPISPNRRNTYMMGIIAGLLIPFAGLYIFMLLDTKVKNRNDVLQYTNKIPVLAEMPKVKEAQAIFSDPEDRSSQAEAFRILSSNVSYILPVQQTPMGRVIFSTSSIKGEGKSHVSINLSLALSSINKKVLLIGGDLRNPQLHSLIGIDKNQKGLTNYLHEYGTDWKSMVIKAFDRHPKHDTLISGSIPPNPASLLTNGRFEMLIEEAKLLYDYIIVDTAPTILVTDTLLVSHLADVTLYVVRANYSEKQLINFSKDLYESGKLKNMAYVLNGVPVGRGYGYGYNYGYDYGYGSKG